MNRVELVGGLTRTPDVSVLRSGAAVWSATIAVNGSRYDPETKTQVLRTTFVSLSVVGWLAERLTDDDLEKGDEVYVVGELDQFEIERDGKKDRKTRVRPLVVDVVRRRSPDRDRWPGQQPAADPWSNRTEAPPF